MTDLTKIPDYILNDARKNSPRGCEEFTDEELSKKTKGEIFEHYLQWQGLIGYADSILCVVESLFNVKLED